MVKAGLPIMVAAVLSAIALDSSLSRVWGIRGEKDIYTFTSNGQPSALVEMDVRWGPDQYYIRIGDKTIVNHGKVKTDDGRKVFVCKRNITNRYSITDSPQKAK
jgi:hypothetical protein